jgi:hypothetical protein
MKHNIIVGRPAQSVQQERKASYRCWSWAMIDKLAPLIDIDV